MEIAHFEEMIDYTKYQYLDSALIGAQVVSPDLKYLYLNHSLLDQLNMTSEDIVGFTMTDKFPGIDKTDVYQRIIECLKTGIGEQFFNEFVYEDKKRVFYYVIMHKVADGVLIFTIDLSETKKAQKLLQESNQLLEVKVRRKTEQLEQKNQLLASEIENRQQVELSLIEANKKLEQLATVDQLTGLSNRRSYEQIIENEMRKARRNKSDMALMLLDLDHFKSINDHYGHNHGDVALAAVGKLISELCRRPEDHAFRMGGEEFALVIGNTDSAHSKLLAEKICDAVAELKIDNEGSSVSDHLTVSIGLVMFDESSEISHRDLYQIADQRLYKAKVDGRNRVILSD